MGPDEAIRVFRDLRAHWLVPMHYGSFRLSFEDIDEPPRWLRMLADEQGLTKGSKCWMKASPTCFKLK